MRSSLKFTGSFPFAILFVVMQIANAFIQAIITLVAHGKHNAKKEVGQDLLSPGTLKIRFCRKAIKDGTSEPFDFIIQPFHNPNN